ncbi:3'(2')/5'-bisphosphate nucleotidase [Venturia nashicola]|uniref:3'(2')/5'-bisphosphate nucleotidase n=1 Tax=Venturia nashicola TaxID=86259 RepID=A0A4Z1PN57_9PEZI|nr:3'(2')/5'-bisphosphate nucleotidase [Venturia nashicola]
MAQSQMTSIDDFVENPVILGDKPKEIIIPYTRELKIAELTVQRAVLATKRVLGADRSSGMDKDDDTPVTIGDLAAQALIISALHHAFPEDTFLGEETAKMLRDDDVLAEKVWALVRTTHLDIPENDRLEEDFLATPGSKEEMMDLIDLGMGEGFGKKKEGRIWVMDPIDGTLTFMRGQQYAVCLCLLEDGEQKVAVLGCPNLSLDHLPITENTVSKEGGYLVSANAGCGVTLRRISSGELQPAKRAVSRGVFKPLSQLGNIEALESKSMDHVKNKMVAAKLGISWPGVDIWSQQMKYVAMAVGGHDVMVRIPVNEGHRSALWDHAGGHLLAEEMGIKITDVEGKEIDFGEGRRFYKNRGNVAAPVALHAQVLKAVQEVMES